MIRRREFLLGAGAAIAGAGTAPGLLRAEEYPARAMRALIGFPAGSGADILGRYFTPGSRK